MTSTSRETPLSAEGARISAETVWGINIFRTRIAASECGALGPTYGLNNRVSTYPIAVFEDGDTR